ncbi:MAG: RraA family protein [Anaerolineae bacterium]|nr:RraA family protein [Anaerolineae bacterium]
MSERQEILEQYKHLRVADVRDGLDWNLMSQFGSVEPEIRPLWRTRVVGIARTARYLPFEGPIPPMDSNQYTEWSRHYYRNICTYPWENDILPGDVIVIDQSRIHAGLLGSNNTLAGVKKGARAYITNGGIRDTDEIILQKIPAWSLYSSQGMVQGRIQFDAKDIPVAIGGVTVRPGDIIVADGDGIIVVPRKMAFDVAHFAQLELTSDKQSRRALYESLGMALDDTVL